MQNFYVVLGLNERASAEDIQAAYRRLARAYHPDVSGADSTQQFLQVQEAWQALGDPERRRAHDDELRRQRRQQARPQPQRPARGVSRHTATERTWVGPLTAEDTLHLQLHMDPLEAELGGEVPVELPAANRCPYCRGVGGSGFACCRVCAGRGRCLHGQRWLLYIPAGLRDGDVFITPLPGDRFVYRQLAIHVSIGGRPGW